MAKKVKPNGAGPLLWIGLGGGGLLLVLLCCGGILGGYFLLRDKAGTPGIAGPAAPFAGTWEYHVGNVQDRVVYQYELGSAGRGRFKEFDVTNSTPGKSRINAEFDYKVVGQNPTRIDLKFTSVEPPQQHLKPGHLDRWRIDAFEAKQMTVTTLGESGDAMVEMQFDKVR